MTLGAAIALAADLFEDLHLVALAGFDEGPGYGSAFHQGLAQGDRAAVAQHEDFAKGDAVAGLAFELFHHEQIARLDLVLFSAGADDRVHRKAFVAKEITPARTPCGREGGFIQTSADGSRRES